MIHLIGLAVVALGVAFLSSRRAASRKDFTGSVPAAAAPR